MVYTNGLIEKGKMKSSNIYRACVVILACLFLVMGFLWGNAIKTQAADKTSDDTETLSASKTFSKGAYDDIVKYVRAQMVARTTSITVVYNTTTDEDFDYKQIVPDAMEYTGVANEGDYIERCVSSYSVNCKSSTLVKNVTYTVDFEIKYYTTAAQEKKVDAKVKEIISSLNLNNKADYEKIREIYNYVCKNVTYAYNSNSNTKYTAYGALFEGKAVCQGYSSLLYRLLLEAGFENRIVMGSANKMNHSWNLIKADKNYYYYADATWDSINKKKDSNGNYTYFLRKKFSDHKVGYLLNGSSDARTLNILKKYKISTKDYDDVDHSYILRNPVVKVSVGCGKLTFTWNKVTGAEKYRVYFWEAGKLKSSDYTTSTKLIASDLINGTKYKILVIAYVNGKRVPYYNEDIKYGTPKAVTPTVTVTARSGKLLTSWKSQTGVTKYRVFTYLNGKYTKVTDTTSTKCTITGLTNNVKYGVLVRAYCAGKWTSYTTKNISYGTPSANYTPAITLKSEDGKVTVKWSKVNAATKYRIFTYIDGKFTVVGTTTGTTYTIKNLTEGVKYGIIVRGYSNGKWSNWTTNDIKYITI